MPHRDWHRLQHRRMASRRMQRFHRNGRTQDCDAETSHDEVSPMCRQASSDDDVARADDVSAPRVVSAECAILPSPSRLRPHAAGQAWGGDLHVTP